MAVAESAKRRQLIQMAEGYLELAVLFEEKWCLADPLRRKLAKRAIDCLNKIRSPLGHKPYILFLKGQAHRVANRFVQALKFFEQSEKLDPESLHCLLAMAWCYKRTERLGEAIRAMEKAIKIEPDSAIAHYNLACYEALAQNSNLALIHLSIALDLNGAYCERVAAEEDFDSIRHLPSFQEILQVHA